MSADDGAPILIVGAGTTGLTMACELARHRAPVRIIDRLTGVNPHCRATGIHARTLEVFHDLGMLAASAAGTRADLVDAHVVVSAAESAPPDLPGGVSVVFDPHGALRQRYGVRGECAYVIRPDGYVGYRCAPPSATRLREYFHRVFLPAPRAGRSPRAHGG